MSGAPTAASGQTAPTAEEIAYWTSLGYVYDPSYAAIQTTETTPTVASVGAAAGATPYPSYPTVGPTYPGAATGNYYGGGGRGRGSRRFGGHQYQAQQIEPTPDYNSIFIDPKKLAEEEEAARLQAEAEAKAEQDKAAATVIRKAAGQVWSDPSLLEFDENDFRVFAGDLGNEVTDEVLTKAFSKYPSLLKAKVVRDKRTGKSKGYGFLSFKDPDDFVKAMKEMNGKYVGNRPIKLRKSQWKDRNLEIVREASQLKAIEPELKKKERAKPYKVKQLNNAGK
ncbi:RNA-binding protein 42 [Actinomortierella wolfii]|nr:RNA-binding protein 42 [Actinomortierella wolfii]